RVYDTLRLLSRRRVASVAQLGCEVEEDRLAFGEDRRRRPDHRSAVSADLGGGARVVPGTDPGNLFDRAGDARAGRLRRRDRYADLARPASALLLRVAAAAGGRGV